jgi:hypothetical protein
MLHPQRNYPGAAKPSLLNESTLRASDLIVAPIGRGRVLMCDVAKGGLCRQIPSLNDAEYSLLQKRIELHQDTQQAISCSICKPDCSCARCSAQSQHQLQSSG